MTHDSIGLGEDGPTHQPIEHIMSLRMIPNLEVFRPCDVVETAECWELALQNADTPSVLALTRQNLPQVRVESWAGFVFIHFDESEEPSAVELPKDEAMLNENLVRWVD